MATREAVLTALFEPVVRAMNCELWGVEYISQGKHSTLRVYLDKDGGVDIDDCSQVSKQLSSILDVEDSISGEYTLEVSSPGLDRILFTLEQCKAFVGNNVKLRLSESFDGRRNFVGLMNNVIDDEIVLIVGNEEYILPFELIEKASIDSQA